jgi:hypothetical protein
MKSKLIRTAVLGVAISGAVAAPASAAGLHSTQTSINCTPATIAVSASTTCTAVVSDLAPADQLPPVGTVNLVSGPYGTFTPAMCTLTTSGPTSSACDVGYTANAFGGGVHEMYANFQGGYDATTSTSFDTSSGFLAFPVTSTTTGGGSAGGGGAATPSPGGATAKKCRKGRKLRRGKCVKRHRKR